MPRIALSLLLLILSSMANAEDSRRLGADVLWELTRLAAPVVSPDGERVVVEATTYPETDDPETTYQPESRLWLLATGPDRRQRPLTAAGGSAAGAGDGGQCSDPGRQPEPAHPPPPPGRGAPAL